MNKKILLTSFFSLLLLGFANGQNKKDREAIKKMCGCYEVTFNYQEAFAKSKDSAYVGSKPSRTRALEWVQALTDEKNKVVLQHLLIVGKGENQHIVKHWRQDWLYQNTAFHQYKGDNHWHYEELPAKAVKGQWTQKVYQVDDSPRYEGTATWVHVDGKSFWENQTYAPLPRREHEQRSDYNLLLRHNRHEITPYGWLHQQHNGKIKREQGKDDELLAQEWGQNTYKKVDNARCQAAHTYWAKNAAKWQLVREKWAKVFAQKADLRLHEKINNKALFDLLLDENFNDPQQIEQLIETYIVR